MRQRPVAHQHHNAALPCGGRRKSYYTLPVLQCAAIFYPRVLTALVFTRTANFGGADVRQVGQVRQVGHQTAAPKRLSYPSGYTALVHNRSGMPAQAAVGCRQHHNAALPCGGRRKSCHTLPVLRCAAQICPTGTDCALFYLHGLSWRRRKPLTAKYNTTLPRRGTSQGGKCRRLHIFTAKRSLATSHLMRRAFLPHRY